MQTKRSRFVVVTGASAGIGRAIAHRFARAGDRVGLIARDAAALEATRREVQRLGGEGACEAADVADAEALFAAARRLEDAFGPIDIWVNDAMETVFSRISDLTPAEFKRVTDVSYLGFVHGTMAALKSMRPRNCGCIVQIGSALAYRGIPLQSAYCGAKHAIRGFTESLRTELLNDGSKIRVTEIDLPAVNTPQFDWARVHLDHSPRPMGRPIEPTVVADAVFHAVEGRSRTYWLGVTTALAILGNAVAPAFLDSYLARAAVKGQQTTRRLARGRRDNLDAPVPDLHRTRGSFSHESARAAPLMSAGAVRAGVVAAGAIFFLGVGIVLGEATRRPSGKRRPRRAA